MALNKGKHLWIVAAGAACITLLVYLPSLRNGFVFWDDDTYVFRNPYIRSLNSDFFRWAFQEFYAANWHPLTWISHAVDLALWGANPLGHHLTSILLHAVSTFLVVILSGALIQAWRERAQFRTTTLFQDDRGLMIAAGATGLLFGLHPLHVESAAWISERKDLLCALFFLLALLSYSRFANAEQHSPEQGRPVFLFNRHYAASLVFFVLALMSKPMAVSLPLVLLILDWHPFRKIEQGRELVSALLQKLPFFVLSIISAVITIRAQAAEDALRLTEAVPAAGRLIVAAKAVITYLWMMLLPVNLVPYHPYPHEVSLLFPRFFLPVLLVAAITVLCIAAARTQRLAASVWGYYLVTLLPVVGIVQAGQQAMADRYVYLPSFGPFLAAGVGAAWIWNKITSLKARTFSFKAAGAALALAVTIVLAALTINQTAVWNNTDSLWSTVIEQEGAREPQGLYPAYTNRGAFLLESGQYDRAIADFDNAVAINPSACEAYYFRGMAFSKSGRPEKAVTDFDKAISLYPAYWEAYVGRDQALKQMSTAGKKPL